MTDVVPIEKRRARDAQWSERLTGFRDRLGRELEDLSNEVLLGMHRRGAGQAASGEPAEAPREGPIHRRMRLLGQLIAGLEAVEPGTVWDDRAGYGSTVFLRDLDSGEETFCTGSPLRPCRRRDQQQGTGPRPCHRGRYAPEPGGRGIRSIGLHHHEVPRLLPEVPKDLDLSGTRPNRTMTLDGTPRQH